MQLSDNLGTVQEIVVAARSSRLSRLQYVEAQEELNRYHPHVHFKPLWVETVGDRDLKTSLRTLGQTDFFTREIDELLLSGQCRLAIHSAKDLPQPLPQGVMLVALTRGVDPSDAVVCREGQTIYTLPAGARIATSSERREQAVRELRPDCLFVDIRGTVEARLAKLSSGEIDGLVVAEAALIRLGLTHLNRTRLPGETTPNQGRLAILARTGDTEMQQLFACIDARYP